MTYDRKYNWTKEFNEEVKIATSDSKFNYDAEVRIDVQKIKLPTERFVKIKLQKWLSKINLMNYGEEKGNLITLTSDNSNEILKYKGWCLSDHLIGLEVEYKNIDKRTINELKSKTEQQFDNYKIIWTELEDK